MASLRLLISLIFAIFAVCGGQITTRPQDSTVLSGEDLTLQCRGSDLYFQWKEFISNTIGDYIYDSNHGVVDPSKHEVVVPHDLTIKSTDKGDGGKYTCTAGTGVGSDTAEVDVVVIAGPSLSPVFPQTMVSGKVYEAWCRVQYSADHNTISDSHLPETIGYVGSLVFHKGNSKETRNIAEVLGEHSTLELHFNYTAVSSDHDTNSTCDVSTQTPSFEYSAEQLLNIQFPATDVELAPRNQYYYVGEYINCTARGNPEPLYRWYDENSEITSPNPQLIITESMRLQGPQHWRCEAYNTVEGEAYYDEDSIEFSVEEGTVGGVTVRAPSLVLSVISLLVTWITGVSDFIS